MIFKSKFRGLLEDAYPFPRSDEAETMALKAYIKSLDDLQMARKVVTEKGIADAQTGRLEHD